MICYLHRLFGESLFVRARSKSSQGPSGLKGVLVAERSFTTRHLSGGRDRLLRFSGQNEPKSGRQDKAKQSEGRHPLMRFHPELHTERDNSVIIAACAAWESSRKGMLGQLRFSCTASGYCRK